MVLMGHRVSSNGSGFFLKPRKGPQRSLERVKAYLTGIYGVIEVFGTSHGSRN